MCDKPHSMIWQTADSEQYAELQIPHRIAYSSWTTHIPFAFRVTEAARPRLLVELGTYTGVSFSAFCQQIARSGFDCMCYAVDTWEGDSQAGMYDESVYTDLHEYIQNTYASFAYLVRSTFDEALELFNDESIDLLHIDGFHSYEVMMHDFEAWLPKMSERGVILMHDINARIAGYGGVQAWREISARFPHFAFEHGYGLGVVLTGKEPPQLLKELAEQTDNPGTAERIRHRFTLLGALQERLFTSVLGREEDRRTAEQRLQNCEEDYNRRLDEERRTAEQRLQDCEDDYNRRLDEERRTAEQRLQHCEDDCNRRLDEERRTAEQRILELTGQIGDLTRYYTQSRSWRVTAPLRYLASVLRGFRGTPSSSFVTNTKE